MNKELKICYWNCRGLSKGKLDMIYSLLDSTFDIIILAEHWFTHQAQIEASPFFVLNSTKPKAAKQVGHENGGIALLAKSSIQDVLTNLIASEFTLSFSIGKHTLLATYLPPRLTNEDINDILSRCPHNTTTMLGDINIRYGQSSRDKARTNQHRIPVIDNFCTTRNLSQILCDSGCSRNDHVFAMDQIPWTYGCPPAIDHLDSDHSMMMLRLSLELNQNPLVELNETTKFAFSLLKDTVIQKTVQGYWDQVCNGNMECILDGLEACPLTRRNELIDNVYSIFLIELEGLCKHIFPTYSPSKIRDTPRKLETTDPLDGSLSNSMAIRKFKQSYRAEAIKNHVKARSARSSPELEALEHYKGIYASDEANEFPKAEEPQLDMEQRRNGLLDIHDLYNVILKYPVQKTGGPDGLDARLFKCLIKSQTFLKTLFRIFSLFFETGRSPRQWNHSHIFLLLKDPLEPFADKTRPVALTNMLRRFYEKLLLKIWLQESWTTLHPAQAGFRRGFNTVTQILLSDELSKTNGISVFLDLKAAFDKVVHSVLLNILKARNCPTHTQRIIFNLMMNECTSSLIVNNRRLKEMIHRDQGVFQGSILSPFLFNIFIDPLAEQLNDTYDTIPKALFYADDIVLKARTLEEAQNMLDVCFVWSLENGMIWGIGKCGVTGTRRNLTLNHAILPKVDHYKYLGVPHGRRGIDWRLYLDQQESKITGFIRSLLIRRRAWNLKTRLIIFKTFIRSRIDYCLPLITLWVDSQTGNIKRHCANQLENIHKHSLLFLFDTDRPRVLLEGISGLGSSSSRFEILQASLSMQLKDLNAINPLTHFLQIAPLLSARGSLLAKALQSPLEQEFRQFCNDFPNLRRRWTTFSKHHIIQDNLKQPGTLHHYIRRRARDKSKADSCLATTLSTAEDAVKWRSNALFHRTVCPSCNDNFNRRHLLSCSLLPAHIDSLKSSPQFSKDLEDIRLELERKRTQNSKQEAINYNQLDFLLNEKDYTLFQSGIEHLRHILRRAAH
jgi:hypothetical protein